jgi:bacterioferritin
MKGDPNVLNEMNSLLSEELTAINQYMVHAEMADNWGYKKLDKVIQARAVAEMKHAEKLIYRILFLEGIPIVSKLNDIHIGSDVPKMFAFDHQAEADANAHYNRAIVIAGDAKDYATRELLEGILKEEDDHIDEIETTRMKWPRWGQIFLSTQIAVDKLKLRFKSEPPLIAKRATGRSPFLLYYTITGRIFQ